MNDQDVRNTPLFKKMVADAPNIEADLRTFNARYAKLVERDDVIVGTILRCHLVIEHFLDEYLRVANPAIPQLNSVRLSFAQKLTLADNPRTSLALIMPGLQCLNRLRNQLAHRLDVALGSSELQPIQDFVRIWRTAGGYDVPEGLEAVTSFTVTACGFMDALTRGIERHGKGRGLIGLFDWYADAPPSS